MEVLMAGSIMQRCRVALIEEINPRKVLLVGEGHGRFLIPLLQHFPKAEVTCVDASASRLEVARRRVSHAGLDDRRVCWIHADVLRAGEIPGDHDLLVTQFFLDCFDGNTLGEVVRRLAGRALEDASWLVADFQIPGRGWRQWRARAIVFLMIQFFRRVTALPASRLEDPSQFLCEVGFVERKRAEFEWGLLSCQLWSRENFTGSRLGIR
jgi:ubiquinone/menaquinone biosynthesis C-methylase UbiE